MEPATTEAAKAESSRVRAFYELTKPGIAGYVTITAGASAFVASRGSLDLWLAINTMLGTWLATAGALALNQYAERETDARMRRTKGRPIPSGRVSPAAALYFSQVLLLSGLAYLTYMVSWVPAAVAAKNVRRSIMRCGLRFFPFVARLARKGE